MSDPRDEILKQEYFKYYRDSLPSDERTHEVVDLALCVKEETQAIKNAMDEYMKECSLELLEYVAKKMSGGQISHTDSQGGCFVTRNGEVLTGKQLFENFL